MPSARGLAQRHRRHQVLVQRVHGLPVIGGRHAELDGRIGREADLGVVVAPVHGDLVVIAAHGTPQPQPRRVAQIAEIQLVPAVPCRGREHRIMRRNRIGLTVAVPVPVAAGRPRVVRPLCPLRRDERLEIGGHRLQHVRGEHDDVFPQPGQVVADITVWVVEASRPDRHGPGVASRASAQVTSQIDQSRRSLWDHVRGTFVKSG